MSFKNNIKLVAKFDRQWNREWADKPGGAKIGYTIQVRIPQRWLVTEGQALVQQSILNQTVPLSINHQFQTGMGWSSADSALLVEEVQSRYTRRAGMILANKADVVAGAEVKTAVYFTIGPTSQIPLSGLNPNVSLDGAYTDGVALLRAVGVPEELWAVIDPLSQSRLLKVAFNQFNPQAKVSKWINNGIFSGPALGVDEWSWDPNMPTHTTGSFTTSTPLVDGALQTGSTLVTKGWGTGTLLPGDVFTIAGVNAVNPDSYIDTGILQSFSVQQTTSLSGAATITISPAIITSGPLQTVTASPANNASITVLMSTGAVNATLATQTSKQSYIFHPEAFAFAMADLAYPLAGANSKRIQDADAKLSMRWSEQWNIQTDQEASRIEFLAGVAPILPYFALRCFS